MGGSRPAGWVGALVIMELSWDLPSGASGGTGEGQGARSHKWTKSNHLVDKVILLGLSSFVMKSSWHCLNFRPPPAPPPIPIWLSGNPGPASVLTAVNRGSGVAAPLEAGQCPPVCPRPLF